MFTINDYFDGKVKSISFKDEKSEATLGVMAKGVYEFKTSKKEVMTVISGKLNVQLPGCESWKEFERYDSFTINADSTFKVKTIGESSYICRYYEPNCNCNCNCT
ncbi:MAG: pyrimidine/purine nucleoside phosphorylase [Candidatus Cloacimonetes bacterium]|nr:pyrimidine/purine nucleoside phosphorylase [Candidatus Cloacimonadota bacterium]